MIEGEKKCMLGYGCARLPLLDANDQGSIDYQLFSELVDAYIARGGCYFDTAYMYHAYQSEVAVGKVVVDRYPREKLVITSKLPIGMLKSKEQQDAIFSEQLQKCHADFFDIYLLHSVMRNNIGIAEKLESFSFVLKKKDEGKIRHIGISFHDSPELLEQILIGYPEIEYVQLQINYLDWEDSVVQSGACHEVAVKHDKKIIVMEPVRGGTLANVPQDIADKIYEREGLSPAAFALRYAAGLQNVNYVLSGMSAINQVIENTELLHKQIITGEGDKELASEVAEYIRKAIVIPCTSCHYCTSGCPKQIPIPEYISLYNSYRLGNDHDATKKNYFTNQKYYYGTVMRHFPRASECIECGQCEKVCPQHINCIEVLKKIKDCFEN